MAMAEFKDTDFTTLTKRAKNGDLFNATTKELEMYTAMLCHRHAEDWIIPKELAQISETVRLLLSARINEQMQAQSLKIAGAAVWAAKAAVFIGVVQIVIGLPSCIQQVSRSLHSFQTQATVAQSPQSNIGAPLKK